MNTAVPVETNPASVLSVPKAKKPSAKERSARKRSPKKQSNKKQVSKAVKPKLSRKVSQVTAVKPEKQKLVRDSFTIPEAEYQILVNAKKSLTKSGVEGRDHRQRKWRCTPSINCDLYCPHVLIPRHNQLVEV